MRKMLALCSRHINSLYLAARMLLQEVLKFSRFNGGVLCVDAGMLVDILRDAN